ncbi:hypothetical protein [Haloferula sp. BvORR071]|uniref:hypothetical protein n=1 Tax=Haloferula sp. BvORR071 TaxID=1396141 RepID=UPI000695EF36|nr:hypothetical protein [Haloferula sp. BvORR071]
MNLRHLCIATSLLGVTADASAAIFAREDFNYADGNLAGSNGGVGWQSAWSNALGTPTAAGGKGVINTVSGQQGARLISALQEPPLGGSKTVWVSFEGKQTTNVAGTASTNSYGGLGLYRGNTEQLLIGKSWPGDYQWKAGTGGTLIGPAVPVSTLAMTKIVARITMVDAATDTLDVWINPADTSSVAALGSPHITRTDPDLSFDTLRIRGGEGDAGVTAESWAFDAVTAGDTLADVVASDSDGDQMLDAWETQHGLVVGINDANLDREPDGATNLQEYQRSSDPNVADTDGDGLSDGVETGTGIFVSAANTGSSPTQIDTDGDGLLDNEENGSGVFNGPLDPGTNPNKVDSDGDTHRDEFEVARGSDPNSAASVPATGDLALVGSDDFNSYPDGPVAGLTGGSGFDYDNTTADESFVGHDGPAATADWDDVFGASNVAGGKLVTLNSGAKREFNGPGEGATAGSDEYKGAVNDTADTVGRTVYIRADMRRGAGATWSGISAFDFGTERAFAGVTSAPNPASGNLEFGIGAPSPTPVYSGIQPIAGRDYTLVMKLDYQNDLISLWVNPDLSAPESAPTLSAPFTLTNWTTAGRIGSGGTDATEWDHFVVARQWSALAVFPGVVPPTDDYLAWISGYPVAGQSGFDQDPDHDGLANGIEQVLGTSPASSNSGLHEVAATGPHSYRFRHSRTNAPATDVTASYEWSANLLDWKASGETDPNGVTATIASSVITDTTAPGVDEIEVTVTVTGGSTNKVFARLKAEQP